MEKQFITLVHTPQGDIPISLKKKFFHDGIPPVPVIIEWFYQMVDFGIENNWQFSLNCLGAWIEEEYPIDYAEIVNVIKSYEDNKK